MFCGLCRKGVNTKVGIPVSVLEEKKSKTQKGIQAFFYAVFSSIFAAMFLFGGGKGALLSISAWLSLYLAWMFFVRTTENRDALKHCGKMGF